MGPNSACYMKCPARESKSKMAQFLGTVVGTKMDKTVKVLVTRMTLHPKLKKYWNQRKVFFAHDENNECTRGDLVRIKECRRLSKFKHFSVEEIVDPAEKITDPQTGEVHIQDNRE